MTIRSLFVLLTLLVLSPLSFAEQDTASEQKKTPSFELSKEMKEALNKDNSEIASDGLTDGERFMKYLKSGFVHIIPEGIDHILFVLGLFLATLKMSKLFWQVTTFTLAHSITLGLAAAGFISLSADVVEPLIALSIAYVAYENIRKEEVDNSRLALIFAFGLLHGLGFAFVLAEFGMPTESFVMSLFAFNIGVEIGQVTVIAAAFALLYFWRTKPSYRMFVQIPASVVIGLIGVYWTLERTIL